MFIFGSPIEFHVLFRQIHQESDDLRKVFNKSLIKIRKV